MGWIVAASVGAVEALKDQGFCRWNYPLRVISRRAKHNLLMKSVVSSSSSSPHSDRSDIVSGEVFRDERAKRTEETLRNVMQLNSWGPN